MSFIEKIKEFILGIDKPVTFLDKEPIYWHMASFINHSVRYYIYLP